MSSFASELFFSAKVPRCNHCAIPFSAYLMISAINLIKFLYVKVFFVKLTSNLICVNTCGV